MRPTVRHLLWLVDSAGGAEVLCSSKAGRQARPPYFAELDDGGGLELMVGASAEE